MTLVIDASAVCELLVDGQRRSQVQTAVAEHHLVAPQLLMAEVLSVLRGWVLGGHLEERRARAAITDFKGLGVELVDMTPLAETAWEFRNNVSVCDAMYAALAATLELPLLTCDEKLARALPAITRLP